GAFQLSLFSKLSKAHLQNLSSADLHVKRIVEKTEKMINTPLSIDAQIQAILAKQEFLFKMQSEQVAQILATVKTQVDHYVQLSEQQAAAGKHPQEMDHTDSSVTLALQEPDAYITQGGGAQSVPPPFPLDPLKQSTELFPMEDSLRQTAKDAPTGASMMDKVKAWGASASAFLNTLLNHRSNGCGGTVNPIDVNTGGETIEDGCAQEPQQPDKTMGNSVNNVGAVLIGSVANEVVSSAAKPKKPVVKRSNAVSRLFRRKTVRGKNLKDALPKDSALDQCTTGEMGPAGFPMSPTFSRQYKLGRVLGEGGFGIVMAATRLRDGRQVAVKFINAAKIPSERWLPDSRSPSGGLVPSEITILQQMRHPNIIQYIDHMMEADAYVLVITELHGSEWQRSPHSADPRSSSTPTENTRGGKVTSMDLFECIDLHHHLPEPLARKIFAQVALAAEYLQANGLVHRDIKDENIVVDSSFNIKLIDFGSAARIPTTPNEQFTEFRGTTLYASPEIVRKEKYRGPEAEMWALGVLLFTMIFGESPFQSEAEIAECCLRMPKGFHLESDRDYHGGCRHLIHRLLEYDPECRITIEEVLEHPWLKSEVAFYQKKHGSFDPAA
ncbi:hypothetical protein CcCBS67573_g08829, partial [Chytriomyces confervae]